ncbi:ABC transporter permease [Nocardioides sambongensis]|uniref:ABC transporter permease n=1 Tax=Nocardioides sambongensis TaxID=2589074 RepID=UPI001E496AC2|nr:ABC transporter permease [Nocardioides sambongensis]
MTRFVGYRVLLAVPTLALVTFLVFLLMQLSPADPAVVLAGDDPSPERLAAIRDSLGLDEPFLHRYLEWLSHAVTGDLGTSPVTHQPVSDDLMRRLPITLSLVLLSLVFTVVIGVALGTVAALNRRGSSTGSPTPWPTC